MPPKKGLSHDDKMAGMQALMMESNDIWTLKDLEKECPKRKGIISQSVKDILQELCDSDLVSWDKIGSGKFFWCFPADAYNRRAVARAAMESVIAETEAEIAQLEREIAKLRSGREDSAQRQQLDSEIDELETALAGIRREAAVYEKMNPEAVKKAQRQAEIALAAANRWTDNIFAVKAWCVKQFNMSSAQFDSQFELKEGFDYFS
jgi:DNA-binding transcriptional regulator GbsR (MarR family)